MKIRRFVFWTILLALLIGLGASVIHVKRNIQTRITEFIDSDNDKIDIHWDKIRFIHENNKRGIRIENLLSFEKASGDSIFTAKQVIFFIDGKLKQVNNSNFSVFVDSPTFHLNKEMNEMSSGNNTIPSLETFDFKDLPSIYINNMSIVSQNEGKTMRYSGIHFMGEARNKAYHLSLRVKDSIKDRDFLALSRLSGNTKNIIIDSTSFFYQNIRICQIELETYQHARAKNEYNFRIFNYLDSLDIKEIFTPQSKGFIAFDYRFVSNENHETFEGYFDGAIVSDEEGYDYTISHTKHQYADQDSIYFYLDIKDTCGHISRSQKLIRTTDNFQYIAWLNNDYQREMQVRDMHFNINLKGKSNTKSLNQSNIQQSGNQLNTISLNSPEFDIMIQHLQNNTEHTIHFESKQDNWTGQIEHSDFRIHRLTDQVQTINAKFHVQSINIPGENDSKTMNSNLPQSKKNNSLADVFNRFKVDVSLLVDSLLVDNKLITTTNEINAHIANKNITLNSSINLVNQYQGKINTQFISDEGGSHGHIFSDGIAVYNQKAMPLISQNIKLKKDTAQFEAFDIKFITQGDSITILPTSIRNDEFLLHLNGNIQEEEQDISIGISAASNRFKGAAALIIATKDKDKNAEIQTVYLNVKRKDGKTQINTELKNHSSK